MGNLLTRTMVKGERVMAELKVQELSDKVLLVTFPSLYNNEAQETFKTELENLGFKVVWMVA